jgi:hypothetical protein
VPIAAHRATAGGEPADLSGDRVAECRQGSLHGRRQRRAEAGRGDPDPHERAPGQPAPQDSREPDDLFDRELVRGPWGGALAAPQQALEREHDDGTRLDPDRRVGEDAGRARGDVEEGIDVERRRGSDLAQGEDIIGQPVQRDRSSRVVAPLGLAADDEPDPSDGSSPALRAPALGSGLPAGDQCASSTVRSRKWVAHEMHGS